MTDELKIPLEYRRSYIRTDPAVKRSALFALRYLLDHFELQSFAQTAMLDMGCGTKFTQCLLENNMPVGRYVGVDVYREMVDFLRRSVDDPRFEYHHVNIHNARYNPTGVKLTEQTRLPFEDGRSFDLICLFSVFTHLEPNDYRAMLKLLRRYVAPQGRIFYTLFIDEKSESGHGMMDAFARRFGDAVVGQTDGFRDLVPDDALAQALYSRDYALDLVDGTGWEILSVDPPNQHMQHQITCRPT